MTTTRGEDESQEPDRAGSEAIRELRRRKPDFVFTRADAIAEGELIDVSQVAREEGITVPDSIAITDNAWDAVVGSRGAAAGPGETYRVRRLFHHLKLALQDGKARHRSDGGHDVEFVVPEFTGIRVAILDQVIEYPDRAGFTAGPVTLHASTHAGDEGETVATIGLLGDE